MKLKPFFVPSLRGPEWLTRINASSLRADAFAALTGATIVLPQGVAFAAIAGLPPEYGFYTAMLPPIIAALFGCSWHTVSGPTTAISALVFAALAGTYAPGSPAFIQAAITLALLVGLMQLLLALLRLGLVVNFVSHSVMTGFISAAAFLIALSQFEHALGLDLPRPEQLLDFAAGLGASLSSVHPESLIIAAVTLLSAWLGKRYLPKWPYYLLAIAAGCAGYFLLGGADSGVRTIGAIPSVVPSFQAPQLQFEQLRELSSAAAAIALVGLLEAMSIARAIALRSGQDIDGNKEFRGQGMANIVGSFFLCYPSSASFTRSGVNYDAGAQSPLSAILAAVFLLIILLLLAPWFAYVPIPAIAGVIILVAWNLFDFKHLRHMLQSSRLEASIAFATMAGALLIDLESGIYFGVMLSLGLYLAKSSRPKLRIGALEGASGERSFHFWADSSSTTEPRLECPQMLLARLDGSLYFAALGHARAQLREIERTRAGQKHMLLMLNNSDDIDLSGLELLEEESVRRRANSGSLYIQSSDADKLGADLSKIGSLEDFGGGRIWSNKRTAIANAVPKLDPAICAQCRARIFKECPRPQ